MQLHDTAAEAMKHSPHHVAFNVSSHQAIMQLVDILWAEHLWSHARVVKSLGEAGLRVQALGKRLVLD